MSAPTYKEPTGSDLDAIIAQHDGVRGDMAREIHALRQRCDAMPSARKTGVVRGEATRESVMREFDAPTSSLHTQRMADAIVQLRAERDEHRGNYDRACQTIAAMHAAAVGEVTGPKRGVVEDVADLKAERDAAVRERWDLRDKVLRALTAPTTALRIVPDASVPVGEAHLIADGKMVARLTDITSTPEDAHDGR